jgi:hypothetical protein
LKLLNYLRLSGGLGPGNGLPLFSSIDGGGVVFRVTLLGDGRRLVAVLELLKKIAGAAGGAFPVDREAAAV